MKTDRGSGTQESGNRERKVREGTEEGKEGTREGWVQTRTGWSVPQVEGGSLIQRSPPIFSSHQCQKGQ